VNLTHALRRMLPVVLLICTDATQAGVNAWTVSGPEGGPLASVAFHPTEANTLLIGSARGVHLSLTHGASWSRMFDGDINDVSTVLYDPSHAGRVFVMGNDLYRSDDDAHTFGAHTGPTANLVSMAIAQDGVLYALNLDKRLFRSPDSGAHWTELGTPWAQAGWPGLIAVDPSNSDILYATFRGLGTYRSRNAGASWSVPLTGSPGTRDLTDLALRLAVDPTAPSRIIAGTPSGLMQSEDGGDSWSTRFAATNIPWVGFDPVTPSRVLALDWHGQLMRSDDHGATWPTSLWPPRIPVRETYAAALSPRDAGHIVVATNEGPMISDDAGATFQLRVTGFVTGTAVSLSAAGDGSVYAALTSPSGIFTRGGQSWNAVNNAPLLDPTQRNSLRQVAVAASDSTRVYAIDMGRRFMRSTDAGAMWIGPQPDFAGRGGIIAQIAVDPADPLVVYATTSDTGLWRSADGGGTWVTRTAGLTSPNYIAVAASDPRVLYASAQAATGGSGIFRSADAGLTWTPTAALPSASDVQALTVDPTDANTAYVVLNPVVLERTRDGGATWNAIDFGLSAANGIYYIEGAIAVDPVYPKTLVVTSSQPALGFLRSVDDGATWQVTPLQLGGVRTALDVLTLNPQRPGLITAGAGASGLLEYQVSPDLELTTAGLSAPLAVGGSSALRLIVKNLGPHAASAAHVTMNLPDFLSVNAAANCLLRARAVDCELPALAVNASRSIDLTLTTSATPSNGFFTANVTGHEPDSATGNNDVSVRVVTESQSDLGVSLTAPAAVTAGSSTSFVATVTNAGPQASSNTHLEVSLPGGVFAQSATPSQGSCVANGSVGTTYKCELDTLDAGKSANVTISVRGDTAGGYTIGAAVTGLDSDPATSNDLASTSLTVNPAPVDPPKPPRAPGGGGGRCDWLLLALLGGTLARRVLSPRPAAASRA